MVALGVYCSVSRVDWMMLIVAIAFVLIAEAINTALESTCDAVSLQFRPSLKIAKDVAAGAVLIASIAAVALGAMVFKPYLL